MVSNLEMQAQNCFTETRHRTLVSSLGMRVLVCSVSYSALTARLSAMTSVTWLFSKGTMISFISYVFSVSSIGLYRAVTGLTSGMLPEVK